jgi:hypothetical protein
MRMIVLPLIRSVAAEGGDSIVEGSYFAAKS